MKKITIFFASLFFMVLSVQSQTVKITKNPYANVNWSTYNQYKGNYHTHTTNSDGSQSPSTVIDEYYSKGYSILAITDHNFTTWPWPNNPGMLAVKGSEFSKSHHMNAMFNFSISSSDLENGIPHVQSNGGIVQINHPGRYNSPDDWSWYLPWYRDYSSSVTLEVFNQGDRYSSDRQLWDNINENYFLQEGKFVWGTSNDDKHSTSHLYGNFTFMLMPDLTEASFRESITNGAFYFCYEPGRSGDANVPRISDIVIDENTKTITISATGYNTIQWIGPGTTEIAAGEVFDYSSYTNQPFIRAVLKGSNGSSYTQPFGFGNVTGTNTHPYCSISAPAYGSSYTAPASVVINANASDADGTISKVEFYRGTTKLGEDLTFPYSYTWSNADTGIYNLTVKATDNEGAVTTSSAVSITVYGEGTPVVVSKRIATGMDDVEQRANGSIYTNSSDLELIVDDGNQTIGLRFANLNIPQGATIASANIQFTCDETSSGITNLTIKGHDADNSDAFTTATNNVSSRAPTSASVSWSPVAWNTVGEAGANQQTPDISSVIQEIVDRTEFSTSSAISIIITGSGERIAESYEDSSSKAALLNIEYTTGTTPTNNTALDKIESSISLFPNPALDGMITISGIQSLENSKLSIYDMIGKLHILNNINCNTTEINVTELSTGIYIVNIADGNQLITKKLIIQ